MINSDKNSFIEGLGQFFETSSLPKIAGKIFAWLLICGEPGQTSAQLAEALNISKGSISTSTQILTYAGFLERVRLPGDKRYVYRIRPNIWEKFSEQGKIQFTAIRQIAEMGLKLTEGQPEESRLLLREMVDFYSFFEKEYPRLIELWHEYKEKRK